MNKNQYPLKFTSALEKREWNIELYGPVYDKCSTPQALTGDEYHMAQHLAEIGFMTVKRTPIWRGDSYAGQKISFQSFIPI